MQYSTFIFSIVATFFFIGCQPSSGTEENETAKEKEEKIAQKSRDAVSDTLSYLYKKVEKQVGNCTDTTQACATILISYPDFGKGAVESKVNQLIREMVLNPSLKDYTAESGYDDFATQFLDSYQKLVEERPRYVTKWASDRQVKVLLSAPKLLTIRYEEYSFTGGEKPNQVVYFKNFSLPEMKEVSFSELLKTESLKDVTKLAEKKFREARQLPDTTSYQQAGFWFENEEFKLNGNFGLTPKGILFYFNPDEIGSYAVGPTEFLLPYAEVTQWLKPDSPAFHLAK